jgi:ATP-binding protein involved in chromosome partitioning
MTKEEQKEELRKENIRIGETLNKIKYKIVVFSGKGGVGKTTVSVNLAYAFNYLGKSTGILDADVTGPNVAKMSGMKNLMKTNNNKILPWKNNSPEIVSLASMIPEGEAVIWRGPLRSKILNSFLADVEWGDLEYLIADLPPGTGDEIITMAQKMNPELAIIVTTPQEMSLIDSYRAINMARKIGIPKIALIENMSGLICPYCGETIYLFGQGGGEAQAKKMDIDFLGSLPFEIKARELSDEGKPIVAVDPESLLTKKFIEFTNKIELILKKNNK